jgi:4-hydroxybenzoate polyprenyltransferase
MNNFINFIKLLRPLNLLIIVLILCLIKYFLINQFIAESSLNNFNFFLFAISTILITGGGYIINDIYDEDVDKINKDKTRIINKELSARIAIFWYFAFNIIALILILYVSYIIQKLTFTLIFIYSIFSLWKYSKYLKTKFLRGNFLVSWLVALSIINIGLFDVIPVISNNSSPIIFKIILLYAAFAFLMTLSREIIKDIEDEYGDKKIHANTIIIKIGLYKTKVLINTINTLVFIFIGLWQYFQYSLLQTTFNLPGKQQIQIWGTDINSILYVIIIQLLLIVFIIKCSQSESKEDFSFLSKFSKFIMILGILSIGFFTYNYIN